MEGGRGNGDEIKPHWGIFQAEAKRQIKSRLKVLLIQPPWYGFQNIISRRFYLGLAYLGAVLEKNGFEVLMLNGESYFENIIPADEGLTIDESSYLSQFSTVHPVFKRILNDAVAFSPDIVGMSFLTANAKSAYILTEILKKLYSNQIPYIAGGVHPTILPDEVLNRGMFDFVVRGEGEETLLELIDAINGKISIDSVKGVSFIKDGKIVHNPERSFIENLDSIPFPAYHLIKDVALQKDACTGITTSRGCPFECTYCASKLIWSRKVRFRSPQNVVDEIADRLSFLGISMFSFNDDTFTLKNGYVRLICKRIIDSGLKVRWHCDTRGDTLTEDLLKIMQKAGCTHIYMGLETGSAKIRKLIKKGIDTDKIENAIILARKIGIATTVYFMVGFPQETESEIQESIDMMKRLKPDSAIWSILTLYPGTEMWNYAKASGFISDDVDWSKAFHHFNIGNQFGSISKESWDNMLRIIESEQKILASKSRKSLLQKLKMAIREPKRVLPFIRKNLQYITVKLTGKATSHLSDHL